MKVQLQNSWNVHLADEFQKPYFASLEKFVDSEFNASVCFPPEEKIFAAFDYCSFEDVKVVIIGQDPYHGPDQANGMCFSVSDHVRIPPSLKNIFKELKSDLNVSIPNSGNLESWAKQGVLLLNATLTVRAHVAGSHQRKGWESFTDAVIQTVNDEKKNVVFILWGSYAQRKGGFIDESKHLVLKSVHPSPLSAYNGFFGSRHFSKANDYLQAHGNKIINW